MLPLDDTNVVRETPPVVLWVGTAFKRKQPQVFFELAKALPVVQFRMVIGPGNDAALFNQIKKQATAIPNIDYIGFVPYRFINKHYARASVLINTSIWEGFPNTFLQAWAHKTPVVSLAVDPDHVIHRNELGFCSGTLRQMVKDVKLLVKDNRLRYKMGENAWLYINREHDITTIGKQYVDLLKTI